MGESKKQAISIRLGTGDMRNIKRLAKRLGARDSDIIRFAIRSTLERLAPLGDETTVGRDLLPVLVESGDELIRYFELDAYRLDAIVNGRADAPARIDRNDIALLAMNTLRDQYLLIRMRADVTATEASVSARSLRDYLLSKYITPGAEPRFDAGTPAAIGLAVPAA